MIERTNPQRHVLHGPLGTVVDLRFVAPAGVEPERVRTWLIEELTRLEAIFSVYDPTSELRRWGRGDTTESSDELSAVMTAVLDWQDRSNGLFNPSAGELGKVWREAEAAGQVPDPHELAARAVELCEPRFVMIDGSPQAVEDCSTLDLNAIAKGFIVDMAAVGAHQEFDLTSITLNIGGDIRHIGAQPIRVAIENPARPYDNEPPLLTIEIQNAAFATSGAARRGFRIAGRTYSHVIDPRSGQPASGVAAVSVAAPLAMTADVVATVGALLNPPDAIAWIAGLDDVAGLVIDPLGERLATPAWIERFGSVRPT